MFEFDQYDARGVASAASSIAHQATRPSEKIRYTTDIVRRSFLLWSEHCIECAAPECYQTCDLFKARPDERCRRFEYGTRRNKAFNGSTGAAAEIVFSQWGRFEARGNSVLFPRRWLNFVEGALCALAPLSNLVGKIVRRRGGSLQWASLTFELLEMASRRLHRYSDFAKPPHGFLLEVYNPTSLRCFVKFECAIFRSKVPENGVAPLPYWDRLSLEPGYNRVFLDYQSLSAVVESGLPYKLSLTPEAVSGTHLVFITLGFVTLRNYTPATSTPPGKISQIPVTTASARPPAKCVVFDLDNTLWNGVLLEGKVTLKEGVKALFTELDRRGILISIASKNNAEDALEQLNQFGLADFIIYPLINWSQKSVNIQSLAHKISIGTDTLIFVDDNPFEREEVASAVPGIEVLPHTAIDKLLSHQRLSGGETAESANRRTMYKQQIEREEALVEFGEDYQAFLRECRIVVSIVPIEEEHNARVAELLQRTNQLNFSGTKYNRDDIAGLLADDSTDKHIIHCKDKYGDYGVVGFSLTQHAAGVITVQDFMLSCRVQGKLIEKAFFNYLAKLYIADKGTLQVNFVSTERNTLARRVLQEIGFDMDSGKQPTLQIYPGSLDVDFLELT